jgi:hypothetical protein
MNIAENGAPPAFVGAQDASSRASTNFGIEVRWREGNSELNG